MNASQQPDKSIRSAYTPRDSDSLALAQACGVEVRRREHPTIASEHLARAESDALIFAGLYATGTYLQVCDKASHEGRRRASEGRVDGREDAEQQGEDMGTHGGSVLKGQLARGDEDLLDGLYLPLMSRCYLRLCLVMIAIVVM